MKISLVSVAIFILFALWQTISPLPAQAIKYLPPDARLKSLYAMAHKGHTQEAIPMLLPYVGTQYAGECFYTELAGCYSPEYNTNAVDTMKAKEYCKKAIAINPEYGFAHHVLGDLYMSENEHAQALASYNRALSSKQYDGHALLARAKANAALKKYPEALKDLDASEAFGKTIHASNDAAPHLLRGSIYQTLGRYGDAVAAYRKSFPRYQDTYLERQIVICLIKAKKYSEAMSILSGYIKRDSQDDNSFFERSKLKALLNDTSGAVNDVTAAIAITPTATYYKARAALYQKLGKVDLAKKDLQNANSAEQSMTLK